MNLRRLQRGIFSPFGVNQSQNVAVLQQGNTDPYWSSVVLLLQDGTHGSTTFTDLSNSGHTMTAAGDAVWTNTKKPTGATTSIALDGTGDYLTTPDSADWFFGTGDATLEAFIYAANVSGEKCIFDQMPSSGNGAWFTEIQGAALRTGYTTGGVWQAKACIGGTVTANTWTHHAVVFDGTTLRGYLNGVQVATFNRSTDSIADVAQVLAVGNNNDFTAPWNGNLAAMRITKGVSRYPSGTTFTPPTLPLPTS